MKHHTHVILVSGQPTPNLTPMLDREIQPEEVIMAVSGDMAVRADWLEDVLKPRGIRTTRWKIDDPYDYAGMLELFLTQIGGLAECDLALNVTGGTKLMAIAAYEVFSADKRPVYYVHPEHDQLVWLHPSDKPSRNLENRLRLEHFFMAHGARLEPRKDSFGVNDELFELSLELVSRAGLYQDALKVLNGLAGSDEIRKTLRSKKVGPELAGRDDFESLIRGFEARSVLGWNQGCLSFKSEQDRFFVNGGWLELYVYGIVNRLRTKIDEIQDAGRGLKLFRSRQKAEVMNELDVVFLADNRLYVIECKTGGFDRPELQKGADILYKLNTLSGQLGGIQARKLLVSYQELPESMRNRAATDRIEICAGTQLTRLEDRLIKWVRQ